MPIQIYNSLTRKLEDFVPLEEGKVTMYSCGPTVYDYFHIGNARTFLVSDIIRRYLEYKGYQVQFVQNLTDIDDKIIRKANEQGIESSELSQKYIDAYFIDAEGLGMRMANVHPCATDHITEIIDLIQSLIDKGYAYESQGDVYYRVTRFDGYGKLSNRNLEDLLTGARVETNEKKEDPRDFDLWKAAKPGEPWWESPWGEGRPGWHIECSAMVMKHLGHTIDIHAGGQDLLFPHHENEIAQSEAITGKPFANYWVHTAFLRIDGNRMGKSEGNFIFIRDALSEYNAETVRHFLLSAHYRHPLDYNSKSLSESASAIRRLQTCLDRLRPFELSLDENQSIDSNMTNAISQMEIKFEQAMDNDFNTASAMGSVYTFVGYLNRRLQEASSLESQNTNEIGFGQAYRTLAKICQVLGIYNPQQSLTNNDSLVEGLMNLVLELRQSARQQKDWATADQIRDQLTQIGIELNDSKSGTNWSISN